MRAHSRAVLAEDDHRGTIVNIDAVSGITRDFHGHMRVRLKARKETLAVSERYAARFRAL